LIVNLEELRICTKMMQHALNNSKLNKLSKAVFDNQMACYHFSGNCGFSVLYI
jgi:hypothetical protein